MRTTDITCLVVHNDYLVHGGETKMAETIADLLSENNIKTIKYFRRNSEISEASFFKKIHLAFGSIFNPQTTKDIKNILEKNRVDFAIIHNAFPLVSNSVYKVLLDNKIPIYKYLHNYHIMCMNGLMNKAGLCKKCERNKLRGLFNKCWKNSFAYTFIKYLNMIVFDMFYKRRINHYIAVSEFVRQKHIAVGIQPDRIYTIYNFIEKITDIPVFDFADHAGDYLYMGRLSEEKGIKTLLEAFQQLPNLRLNIMGTGEQESELKEYVRQNQINNVNFLGFKSGREQAEIIAAAKAILVPSQWHEPATLAVAEAYNLGTPVIGSNTGGTPEMILVNDTGYVFESGNANDLIASITKMEGLSNEEYSSMRKNCLELFTKKFAKERYLNEIHKIL